MVLPCLVGVLGTGGVFLGNDIKELSFIECFLSDISPFMHVMALFFFSPIPPNFLPQLPYLTFVHPQTILGPKKLQLSSQSRDL